MKKWIIPILAIAALAGWALCAVLIMESSSLSKTLPRSRLVYMEDLAEMETLARKELVHRVSAQKAGQLTNVVFILSCDAKGTDSVEFHSHRMEGVSDFESYDIDWDRKSVKYVISGRLYK